MQNPAEFATPQAKRHQCHLYIIVLIHFVLGIMLTVGDPGAGFIEIIIPLFLLCGAYGINFFSLIFYMMIMVSDFVKYLSFVGL